MKYRLNKSYIKQISAFRVSIKNINAMAAVKGGQLPLVGWFVRIIPVTGLQTTCARVRSIVVFLKLTAFLISKNGAKGACLILKVYAVTLQQCCGGHIVKDLTELKFRISRTNSGLPRVIPVQHRQLIRAGDPKVIKFWLTLFNLYRVLEFTGDYRLASLSKTIISPAKTGPGFVQLRAELLAFIPLFFKALTKVIGLNAKSIGRVLMEEYARAKAEPLLKSSPFTYPLHKLEDLSQSEQKEMMEKVPVSSTHPIAVHEAANALANNSELMEPSSFFLGLLPMNCDLRLAWRECVRLPLIKGAGTQKAFTPTLGKLSLKAEPAGKVRVFAMVDCWTQWLLKPLHLTIFNHILPGISQDGTLDQLKPVHALLKRDPSSLFSLDLSAATDRLPIWLQAAIVEAFAGKEYAHNWVQFLTARDYVLTLTDKNKDVPVRYKLRYAVGQPMGAYSSWAMLALTHHLIVQFCAYSVGVVPAGTWFRDYAILGDDIVIGNAKVAKRYIEVLATLGVGVGLHKSLISAAGTALEFAKRTFVKGVDVSPIPLTEWIAAMGGPACAVEFIRKYNLSLAGFIKAAGYGFNVLGRLHMPLGKLNAKVRLIILALNIPQSVDDVETFFELGMAKAGRALFETQAVIDQMISKEFKLLKAALNKVRLGLHTLEGDHLHSIDRAKELLTRVSGLAVKASTLELIQDCINDEVLPLVDGVLPDNWLEICKTNTLLEIMQKYPGNTKLVYKWMWADTYSSKFNPKFLEFIRDVISDLSSRDLVPEMGTFLGMSYKVTPASYLRTLASLYEAEASKELVSLMKRLQLLTQADIKVRANTLASSISDTLVHLMLSRYEMSAKELFMGLISLSKMVGKIPLANLSYARVVDDSPRGFTDGMHIRLWKALSGLAQGTQKAVPNTKAPDPNAHWFT